MDQMGAFLAQKLKPMSLDKAEVMKTVQAGLITLEIKVSLWKTRRHE